MTGCFAPRKTNKPKMRKQRRERRGDSTGGGFANKFAALALLTCRCWWTISPRLIFIVSLRCFLSVFIFVFLFFFTTCVLFCPFIPYRDNFLWVIPLVGLISENAPCRVHYPLSCSLQEIAFRCRLKSPVIVVHYIPRDQLYLSQL